MRRSWQALVNGGFLGLALAACAAQNWEKPGASDDQRRTALAECQSEARVATDQESRINQDISSTFQNDWQRTGVARTRNELLRDRTRSRGEDILERCMVAKGWVRAKES